MGVKIRGPNINEYTRDGFKGSYNSFINKDCKECKRKNININK